MRLSLVDQAGAASDADQGSDIVEQVDEQEDEEDLDQADAMAAGQAENAGKIELEGCVGDRAEIVGLRPELDRAGRPAG